MKKSVVSLVVCFAVSGHSLAQDFDVQRAMDQVRQENLQRMGVERKQEIVSILRKRAEDLAAIEEAGFTITQDGELERMQVVAPSTSSSADASATGLSSGSGGDSGSESGLFSEGVNDPEMDEELMPAWMAQGLDAPPATGGSVAGSPAFKLKAIIAGVAMLDVNGSQKRYTEGSALPGGFTLTAVNPRSIEVKKGDRPAEVLYMDWSSASAQSGGQQAGAAGEGGSTPRVFMQSGQPVENLMGEPF